MTFQPLSCSFTDGNRLFDGKKQTFAQWALQWSREGKGAATMKKSVKAIAWSAAPGVFVFRGAQRRFENSAERSAVLAFW